MCTLSRYTPVREPVPVMRVGLEAGDHVVHGVSVPRLRDALHTLYGVREGVVCRYLQRNLDVSGGSHTPAIEGIRGQASPQHDAVVSRIPGGYAQRKGISDSRSHAAPFEDTFNSSLALPTAWKRRGRANTVPSISFTPSTTSSKATVPDDLCSKVSRPGRPPRRIAKADRTGTRVATARMST